MLLVGNVSPGEQRSPRGPAGVEGWFHISDNEERLTALCAEHGLRWAYHAVAYDVDPDVPGSKFYPGTVAVTYVVVGQLWQGDGDSSAERYWDIAQTIAAQYVPDFDFHAIPAEPPSSMALGPGLWHLDRLCAAIGCFWCLIDCRDTAAENFRKGQALVGGLYRATRKHSNEREEILAEIIEMLEGQLGV